MIKAVIFDLDDTLAPERSFVRSGYRAVAEKLSSDMTQLCGFMALDAEAVSVDAIEKRLNELFEEDSRNVFNRLFDDFGVKYDKDDIMSLVKIYREHDIYTEMYEYYSDVMPVLDELKNRGVKIGILSDGFLISQRNKVMALGADKLFDTILLTDELGREFWKPAPDGFLRIADDLAIELSEMMYVGDNPGKDFYVSAAIPITTVRVMRPGSVYEHAEYREGIREQHRIDSLEEIVGLL